MTSKDDKHLGQSSQEVDRLVAQMNRPGAGKAVDDALFRGLEVLNDSYRPGVIEGDPPDTDHAASEAFSKILESHQRFMSGEENPSDIDGETVLRLFAEGQSFSAEGGSQDDSE